MNTQFVYTFKTRKAVLNHLRALVQLSSSFSHSQLPLSDFRIDYPYIYDCLSSLRKFHLRSAYVGFRQNGFEFYQTYFAFFHRMQSFSDVIASYEISFTDGHYELRQISLTSI